MYSPYHLRPFIGIITCALFLGACSGGGFLNHAEGKIRYSVSFPLETNSILLELYPKEMILEFSGDKMHSSIRSSYGVVCSDFIMDHGDKKMTQTLKSFGEKFSMNIEGSQVKDWLKQFPTVRIEYTNEQEVVAGYNCEKAIAHFENDSIAPIPLYFTKELKLPQENWWNQFAGIEGFLLGYDIEQYGKRMRLLAQEVSFEEIPAERFQVSHDYTDIGMSGMDHQLKKLADELMN